MLTLIERTSKVGRVGEELAAECLDRAGFRNIENLNETNANHVFADISAYRGDHRYMISVKARNRYQASRKINGSYNLLKISAENDRILKATDLDRDDITKLMQAELRMMAEAWNAIPAWLCISMVPALNTFSCYFGLVDELGTRRSIPMGAKDLSRYETLARDRVDDRIAAYLSNR